MITQKSAREQELRAQGMERGTVKRSATVPVPQSKMVGGAFLPHLKGAHAFVTCRAEYQHAKGKVFRLACLLA